MRIPYVCIYGCVSVEALERTLCHALVLFLAVTRLLSIHAATTVRHNKLTTS